MSIRISQNSFSKGILSPSLWGRVDLEQYNLGVKQLNNGIVLQEGCVQNRSGLEFLVKTKYEDKKTRLIPFVFNTEQSYIIELGEGYFRFLKDGEYILDENRDIYEIENPYLENELFDIDYVQQKDVITLVHKNHKPKELSRYNHNDWRLEEIVFSSSILPPENINISYTGSLSSNTTVYEYVVTSVDKTTNEESTRSASVSVQGHLEAYWTTSEYITLSWDRVENAQEYNVYRSVNGIFGYIGTTLSESFKDNNIEPDLTTCAPIHFNPFEDENPSCVSYYQQRKVYASSDISPETIWTSQTGTNNNFNISRPLSAVDSITMTISDNEANKIQHLIAMDDLIVMTSNAEWCVNGADGVFSATPSPVSKLQSYYGSSKVKPVISGSMILFVQSGGNIVRDLGYSYLSNSYDGEELTIFSSHLFEGKTIVDMGYTKEPYRILWCIMSDGSINALTYNPKQKIAAWHTHTTQGKFESIAVIRENNEDIAYFVIEREISGKKQRFIERFKSRVIKTTKDSFFLDCAMKKEFDIKVGKISGLEHLKNTKVRALLDCGVVEELYIDEYGTLTLPYEAKNVLIGLPYEFRLETMNFESEDTLGLKKLINKAEIKILNSREDFFVQNENMTYTQGARDQDSINHSEKLFSKDVEFCLFDSPKTQKSITIVQKNPLPITILSICAVISLEEVEAR